MNVTQRLIVAVIQCDEAARGVLEEPESIDWTGFEAATRTFRALTLQHLKKLGAEDLVPEDVLAGLREGARLEVLMHVRRQALIRDAVRVLTDAGVEVVFLKGVGLAHLAYPEPQLRPMADVDLWARGADVDRVGEALSTIGLEEPIRFQTVPRDKGVLVLQHVRAPTLLEVHPAPDSFREIWSAEEVGALWNRAVEIDAGGVPLRTMAPEDLLIHTCLHASYHHHFDLGLRPHVDVAMLLRSHGSRMDWQAVVDRFSPHPEASLWVDVFLQATDRVFATGVPVQMPVSAESVNVVDDMVDIAVDLALTHRGLRGTFLDDLATIPTLGGRIKALLHRGTKHPATSGGRDRISQLTIDVFGRMPRHLRRWAQGGYDRQALASRRSQVEGWHRLESLARDGAPGATTPDEASG